MVVVVGFVCFLVLYGFLLGFAARYSNAFWVMCSASKAFL